MNETQNQTQNQNPELSEKESSGNLTAQRVALEAMAASYPVHAPEEVVTVRTADETDDGRGRDRLSGFERACVDAALYAAKEAQFRLSNFGRDLPAEVDQIFLTQTCVIGALNTLLASGVKR